MTTKKLSDEITVRISDLGVTITENNNEGLTRVWLDLPEAKKLAKVLRKHFKETE